MRKIWTTEGSKDDNFFLGEKNQTFVEGKLIRIAKRRIGRPFTPLESKDPQIVPVGMADSSWLQDNFSDQMWCAGAVFYDQFIAEIEVDGAQRLLSHDDSYCPHRVIFGRLMIYAEALAIGLNPPAGIQFESDELLIIDGQHWRPYESYKETEDPTETDRFIERERETASC